MKTVYADAVLLYNFCFDYLLLYVSAGFLNINHRIKRMILSAGAGALFSLLCNIIINNSFLRIVSGVLFLPLMCLIGFGKTELKMHIKINVTVYIFSLLLGGVVMFFVSTFETRGVTLPICALGVAVMVYFKKIMSKLFVTRLAAEYVEIEINNANKKKKYKMFCDSGNCLTDPYVNLPMIVLKESEIDRIIDENTMMRLVPINTVSGSCIVKAFTPEYVGLICNKGLTREVKACVCFVRNNNLSSFAADGIIPAVLV